MSLVSGMHMLYEGEDCITCYEDTTNYRGVCRSEWSFTTSYCCTENDFTTNYACKRATLCTFNATNTEMYSLMCPHRKYDCGVKNPNIQLSLGNE